MFIPREPYPDGTRGAAVHRDTFVSECDDPSAEALNVPRLKLIFRLTLKNKP